MGVLTKGGIVKKIIDAFSILILGIVMSACSTTLREHRDGTAIVYDPAESPTYDRFGSVLSNALKQAKADGPGWYVVNVEGRDGISANTVRDLLFLRAATFAEDQGKLHFKAKDLRVGKLNKTIMLKSRDTYVGSSSVSGEFYGALLTIFPLSEADVATAAVDKIFSVGEIYKKIKVSEQN